MSKDILIFFHAHSISLQPLRLVRYFTKQDKGLTLVRHQETSENMLDTFSRPPLQSPYSGCLIRSRLKAPLLAPHLSKSLLHLTIRLSPAYSLKLCHAKEN
jgi:hypothetical protein